MNTFTKILLGTGITATALLAAAAPATAAPTPTAADRLTGPLIFQGTSGTPVAMQDPSGDQEYVAGFMGSDQQIKKNAAMGSIPAPGTRGPIMIGDKCIGWNKSYMGLYAVDCSLSTVWTFDIDKAGNMSIVRTGQDSNYNRISYAGSDRTNLTLNPTYYGDVLNPMLSEFESGISDAAVSLTFPSTGDTVDTNKPTFAGIGAPGATVVVTDNTGTELCRATVDANTGQWSCTSTIAMTDGPTTVTATQIADGTTTTATVDFTVAQGEDTPIIAPLAAGGTALIALAGTAIFFTRRARA